MFPWGRLALCLLAVAWGLHRAFARRRDGDQPGASLMTLTPAQRRVLGLVAAAIGGIGAITLVVRHLGG